MTELHETRLGQQLMTHTLPELVRQLERLNQNLERLADLQVRAGLQPQPQSDKETDHGQDLHPQNP